MKYQHPLILCITWVMLFQVLGISSVFAEAKKLDSAMEMLQSAKTASDPLPMLMSAKNTLSNANKGNKVGDRMRAMEYVTQAIAELKAGNKIKMTQKINAAIAVIHAGKGMTKSK